MGLLTVLQSRNNYKHALLIYLLCKPISQNFKKNMKNVSSKKFLLKSATNFVSNLLNVSTILGIANWNTKLRKSETKNVKPTKISYKTKILNAKTETNNSTNKLSKFKSNAGNAKQTNLSVKSRTIFFRNRKINVMLRTLTVKNKLANSRKKPKNSKSYTTNVSPTRDLIVHRYKNNIYNAVKTNKNAKIDTTN